jgi:hypothetical protein
LSIIRLEKPAVAYVAKKFQFTEGKIKGKLKRIKECKRKKSKRDIKRNTRMRQRMKNKYLIMQYEIRV